MSNEDNQNNNQQPQGKITPETVFKQLNQAKVKSKGEDLKKAVEEQLKAHDVADAADEKVAKIFEEIQALQTAKYPA